MKKILSMLTVTMMMSVVLFGFVNRNQVAPYNGSQSSKIIRFVIDRAEHTAENLQAHIRVIDIVTGKPVHDNLFQLTKENGKYVTEPLTLGKGNYRVEALIQSAGEHTTYANTRTVVITEVK